MEQKLDTDYDELLAAIKKRFPNAQFVISCFDSIEDIENKVLTNMTTSLFIQIVFFDFHNNTQYMIISLLKKK